MLLNPKLELSFSQVIVLLKYFKIIILLIYFKTDVSIDHGAQLLISIRLDSLFQENFVVVDVGISFYKVLPTPHSCRYFLFFIYPDLLILKTVSISL